MKRLFTAALLVTAFGATTIAPTPASACINSMERFEDDPQVQLVDTAWEAVQGGHYGDAIEKLTGEWEGFVPGKLDPSTAKGHTAIERRALRAIAVAHVRAQHKKHFDWARAVLHDLSDGGKGGDAVSAHYAEALIANGEASVGRILLEELAKRHGISDAYGWRLLAELRTADGDKAGAEQAMATATTMEKKSKAVPRRARSKKRRAKQKKMDKLRDDQLYN